MPMLCSTTAFLLFIYLLLLWYYRRGWKAIADFTAGKANNSVAVKISVIIPARNEEKNIGACITSLLQQSFPKDNYEIIVVDDHSTDNTAGMITSLAVPNLVLISLKDYVGQPLNSYKKKAIEVAVAQAKGELLVTTDADCVVPANWLQTIAAFYEKYQPAFIVMPVAIRPHQSFIALFQALDFMSLQGITGASVYKKFHSMCNGANLAYTRAAYYQVNGFEGIDSIASGDDMLLMHKIAKQYPGSVYYLKSAEVMVQTLPVATIKDFFNQRIRWASKAATYDDKRIFWVLLHVYLLNVLLLLMPLFSVFTNPVLAVHLYPVTVAATFFEWWLLLLVIKTVAELFFMLPVARFFNEQKTLFWFPVMQPFHILYTVIAGWLGQVGSYRWKDRTVK